MTLRELFDKYHTDKGYLHNYEAAYELLCGHLRQRPRPKILEIGVYKGASLCVWRDWFGPEAYIAGIEIDSQRATAARSLERVFIGDQTDPAFLERVLLESGSQFDLIVDDGCHLPSAQEAAFVKLWPAVTPGGVYVIEDANRHPPLIAKWARGGTKGPAPLVHQLYQQALRNMSVRRRIPEAFYCYCGEAVFIVRHPGPE